MTGASTLSATRYYTLGGQTVAVRTAPALAGVTTLIPDTQNTAQYAVTDTTNKLTVKRQDPFGGVRGQAGTFPGDHGFLDKPTDTTGLTQVGARYYDPGLGRFISVDPIMDLADPQQWSAYAYANNNPTTWSDPTGLVPAYDPGASDVLRPGVDDNPGVAQHRRHVSTPASTPAAPATTTAKSTIWWATPSGIGGKVGDWVSTHQETVKEVALNAIPGYSQYQFTNRTYTAFQTGDFSQWGGFTGWNEELRFQVGITVLDFTGVGEGLSLLAAPARAGLKTTVKVGAEDLEANTADEALAAARSQRDALAAEVGSSKATVTGGYDPARGPSSAISGCNRNPLGCAENDVERQLGIDPSGIQFTEAIRPRTGQQVPICHDCQVRYGPSQFPAGTLHKPGGRWDELG
ncbi:RHS repeat-associated core domain-containing protein [Luteimicrobium subarcticum]|uniref:RHS repeat-associated core domain-containing protein n=1 Tax=Luteimicrobium subarcticum TaxID=620910 RepID=UPI0012FE248E|nr:RHS repeat-associated core domain-containing protein [Luteimicrobium subarcticum]